ncbi:AKIP protein, partial [Polyodon spathula]|nr:AKIP protein [Polyodon spathula]
MAVSPLESWLSLRYSLPPQEGAAIAQLVPSVSSEEELPRLAPPAHREPRGGEEGREGGATVPLLCKNVLEIRRRKMNRHKYKKLLKRSKFLRRRVSEGRRKRKQVRERRARAGGRENR